jgi:hypothetical protein
MEQFGNRQTISQNLQREADYFVSPELPQYPSRSDNKIRICVVSDCVAHLGNHGREKERFTFCKKDQSHRSLQKPDILDVTIMPGMKGDWFETLVDNLKKSEKSHAQDGIFCEFGSNRTLVARDGNGGFGRKIGYQVHGWDLWEEVVVSHASFGDRSRGRRSICTVRGCLDAHYVGSFPQSCLVASRREMLEKTGRLLLSWQRQ